MSNDHSFVSGFIVIILLVIFGTTFIVSHAEAEPNYQQRQTKALERIAKALERKCK